MVAISIELLCGKNHETVILGCAVQEPVQQSPAVAHFVTPIAITSIKRCDYLVSVVVRLGAVNSRSNFTTYGSIRYDTKF